MQERGIKTRELYNKYAGVLSVRIPTGARAKASLASTNTLPASDPYATQLVAYNIPKPLAGPNQKTQMEQLRQELQDAGVLSARTPTGARSKASLATTNSLPAIDS